MHISFTFPIDNFPRCNSISRNRNTIDPSNNNSSSPSPSIPSLRGVGRETNKRSLSQRNRPLSAPVLTKLRGNYSRGTKSFRQARIITAAVCYLCIPSPPPRPPASPSITVASAHTEQFPTIHRLEDETKSSFATFHHKQPSNDIF